MLTTLENEQRIDPKQIDQEIKPNNKKDDHIQQCSSCQSAVWLEDKRIDQLRNNEVKKFYCNDCHSKIKLKKQIIERIRKDKAIEDKSKHSVIASSNQGDPKKILSKMKKDNRIAEAIEKKSRIPKLKHNIKDNILNKMSKEDIIEYSDNEYISYLKQKKFKEKTTNSNNISRNSLNRDAKQSQSHQDLVHQNSNNGFLSTADETTSKSKSKPTPTSKIKAPSSYHSKYKDISNTPLTKPTHDSFSNFKKEIDKIDKYEKELTSKMLKQLSDKDSDIDSEKDKELRKTKNEEWFLNKIESDRKESREESRVKSNRYKEVKPNAQVGKQQREGKEEKLKIKKPTTSNPAANPRVRNKSNNSNNSKPDVAKNVNINYNHQQDKYSFGLGLDMNSPIVSTIKTQEMNNMQKESVDASLIVNKVEESPTDVKRNLKLDDLGNSNPVFTPNLNQKQVTGITSQIKNENQVMDSSNERSNNFNLSIKTGQNQSNNRDTTKSKEDYSNDANYESKMKLSKPNKEDKPDTTKNSRNSRYKTDSEHKIKKVVQVENEAEKQLRDEEGNIQGIQRQKSVKEKTTFTSRQNNIKLASEPSKDMSASIRTNTDPIEELTKPKKVKKFIRDKMESVVNKMTFAFKQQIHRESKKPDHLNIENNEMENSFVNEPDSNGKRKRGKKSKDKLNKSMSSFNLQKNNQGGSTKLNSKESINKLINDDGSFIDKSRIKLISKGGELNRHGSQNVISIKKRSPKKNNKSDLTNSTIEQNSRPRIGEHGMEQQNKLFEMNKMIFTKLKGDKNEEDFDEDLHEKFLALTNVNAELMRTTNSFNGVHYNKNQSSIAIQAFDDAHHESKDTTGQCKIVQDDGSEYSGEIKNGKYHGHGIFTQASGHTQIGDWLNGQQCGNGKMIYKDGTKQTGMFKNGLKHGKGYTIWSNGKHSQTGFQYRDKKHGHGIEKFSNGDVQEGTQVQGKRHGKGHFKWSSNTYQKGDWVHNMMEGDGVLVWPTSGRRQEGQMKGNQRNGIGTFHWPDGSTQQGSFKDDARCGFGVLTNPDGKEWLGSWEADAKHGFGSYKINDKELFNAQFWQGKEVTKEQFEAQLQRNSAMNSRQGHSRQDQNLSRIELSEIKSESPNHLKVSKPTKFRSNNISGIE